MTVPRDIIIEFTPAGAYVKVSAVCAHTGTEVSIVGNARASRKELETIAVRKLTYVMKRDAEKPRHKKSGLIA